MADEEIYDGTDFQEEYEGDEGYEEMGGDLAEDGGAEAAAVDQNPEEATAEIDELKNKLRALEEEANKLKGSTTPGAVGGATAGTSADGAPSAADQAAREEVDARSIYVGNVDYGCTPEELQMHFSSCGTVNRVTILTDKMGNPKGFAYVEFLEVDAVASSLLLNDTELRGRQIKVSQKRTNMPGLKQRGRGRGRGRGGGRGMFMPMPYMPMPYMPYMPYAGRGGGRGRGRGGRFYSPY